MEGFCPDGTFSPHSPAKVAIPMEASPYISSFPLHDHGGFPIRGRLFPACDAVLISHSASPARGFPHIRKPLSVLIASFLFVMIGLFHFLSKEIFLSLGTPFSYRIHMRGFPCTEASLRHLFPLVLSHHRGFPTQGRLFPISRSHHM